MPDEDRDRLCAVSFLRALQGDPTYLIVNQDGAIENYGLNAVCTHLGCVVPWVGVSVLLWCGERGEEQERDKGQGGAGWDGRVGQQGTTPRDARPPAQLRPSGWAASSRRASKPEGQQPAAPSGWQ